MTRPLTASAGIDAGRFAGAASCTATVEQTAGPYYLDVDQIRSDIREDREGVPLRGAARVLDADGCTPIPDAVFEIWHCDAAGLYSGFEAASTGRGNARDDSRYLRGANATDGISRTSTTMTTEPDGDGYLGLITIGVEA